MVAAGASICPGLHADDATVAIRAQCGGLGGVVHRPLPIGVSARGDVHDRGHRRTRRPVGGGMDHLRSGTA